MFESFRVFPDLLDEASVRRVTDAEARTEYGIYYPGILDGIVFPYFNPSGDRVNARIRRDNPDVERGKTKNKYVAAMYDSRHLYFPPRSSQLLRADVPVVIVESEKGALALTALSRRTGRAMLAIGTGGCWGWRGRIGKTVGANGERVDELGVLPDFAHLNWAGRWVAVCFDANVTTNGQVRAAEKKLLRELESRGADVRSTRIPAEPGVNGPDDYLARHSDEHLLDLLDSSDKGTSAPVMVRLSDVEPEEISWLWPGRLALGKLSLLIGDPGTGKSTAIIDIASRISTGGPWPDGGESKSGNIILLTAEDGIADTIRPRVDLHRGDPSRFHVLNSVRSDKDDRPFSLETDIPKLERAIEFLREVRLVIIDPLSAYLGERDSYKDPQIRAILTPLAKLAECHKIAIVGIVHMTKSAERKALYRALGSIAFVAAARTVYAVGRDPEDDNRRFLVCVKNNLAPASPALAFTIIEKSGRGVVRWENQAVEGVDADSILGAGASIQEREERQDVDSFLRELLADGQVSSNEVFQAGRQNGLSDSTLNRAKRRLGIHAEKVGQPGKVGKWYWSLPKAVTHEGVTTFEQAEQTNPIVPIGSSKIVNSADMTPFGED